MELVGNKIVFVCVLINLASGNLDNTLKYYETLHPTNLQHRITKRDVDTDQPQTRQLQFDSLGRHFHLVLQKKRGVLSTGFKVVAVDKKNKERTVNIDNVNMYHGYVVGEERTSAVRATWEDEDNIIATVRTKNEIYVIEPSWRHLPESDNHTMIVYRKSDVKMDDDMGKSYCGYVDMEKEIEEMRKRERMNEQRNDAMEYEDHNEEDHETQKYKERKKRQTAQAQTSYKPSRNTCQLMLVADYRFFEKMGQSSLLKTSSYLISLIDRVDNIYRDTDFGQGYTDMGFEIKEMRIHEEATAVDEKKGETHYNMETGTWETKPLLEAFSRDQKWKNFCLAHLFTHQPFDGGVLGLAYIGSPRTYSVGGICSPEYYKDGYRLYLNTGWSSSLNGYNRRLLTQEADLVTTHELGHNWGSEHDPDTNECSPSSFDGGKYIMYTYSVSGYDPNNKVFSPCTIRSVGAVLRGKSYNCFNEQRLSYCGNNLVEPPEEQCDVGPEGQKDEDPCCTRDCRLKGDAECSDMNHVCCIGCKYAPKETPCHEEEENLNGEGSCELPGYCNGTWEHCPTPPPKPDGENCLDRGKCKNGTCQSFCETLNKTSCVCDKVEDSCKWCCKSKVPNATCTAELAGGAAIYLPNGMPCVYGYCIEGTCEKQVTDMVQRFWSIIENISPDELGEFMKANLVGTVIILSLIIWIPVSCCVSYQDRKMKRKEEEENKWLSANNTKLIRPENRNNIRTSRKTYNRQAYRTPRVTLTQQDARGQSTFI